MTLVILFVNTNIYANSTMSIYYFIVFVIHRRSLLIRESGKQHAKGNADATIQWVYVV